jgi:hypothetical protein
MAITPWLHYADPTLAPLCRSPTGSNVPISDIMRTDRWNAGTALMEAQSPEAWDEFAGAGELVRANAAAIGACSAAAVTAKEPQRCTIEVSPSEKRH